MKIILFGADWCIPCQGFKPVFKEIMKEVEGVEFEIVNVDLEPELRSKYRVMSVPTIIVLEDEQLTGRLVGVYPKDFIIEKIMKGDW